MDHLNMNLLVFLICVVPFIPLSTQADLNIIGDDIIFPNTEVTYQLQIVNDDYPFKKYYIYEFDINLPKPVHEEIFGDNYANWTHDFKDIPLGHYTMDIKVSLYVYHFKAWVIATKTLTIKIQNDLNELLSISGKQDGLPIFTLDHYFMNNRTVNFTSVFKQNSILNRSSTKLKYLWTLNGPGLNHTKFNESNFQTKFNQSGDYNLKLDVIADIQPNFTLRGESSTDIFIRIPITNLNYTGNPFVKNGSLLKLNVTCDGSPNFLFCYKFSDMKNNESCFDSGETLSTCYNSIIHYFPKSGDKYVKIGIRNDVSDILQNIQIKIYPVPPKPPILFVIIPLLSSILVIVIIVFGVAFHIRQHRRLNATIEEATIESFGFYSQDDDILLVEKTFFQRVRDSLRIFINQGHHVNTVG